MTLLSLCNDFLHFVRYENALTCGMSMRIWRGYTEANCVIEPVYNPIYQHIRLMLDMGIGFFFVSGNYYMET